MKIKKKLVIFQLLLPFISIAQGDIIKQTILNPTQGIEQHLTIDTTNLKGFPYRGETVFRFNCANDSALIIAPDNLPDGKYVAYFYNDTSKLAFVITYHGHKKNGMEIAYYPDGKINRKQNYKNGILDGEYDFYYRNAQISLQRNYKNGLEDGYDIGYCENGKKSYESKFKNGFIEGISRAWDCNTGKLKSRQKYHHGRLIKFRDYK